MDPVVSFPCTKKIEELTQNILTYKSSDSFSQLLDFQKISSSSHDTNSASNNNNSIDSAHVERESSVLHVSSATNEDVWNSNAIVEKITTFPSKASKIELNIYVHNLSSFVNEKNGKKGVLSSDQQKQVLLFHSVITHSIAVEKLHVSICTERRKLYRILLHF